MASTRMFLVNAALRFTLKPVMTALPINDFTLNYLDYPGSIIKMFSSVIPNARGCSIRPFQIEDLCVEWVQWTVYEKDNSKCKVIVYCPGGAYLVGSPTTHRPVTTRLAKAIRGRVLAVDYRKAPKHIYPAAHFDMMIVYKWLLEQGFKPENIAFMGDSAGGNLAISAAIRARELGLPMPSSIICWSPWMNMESDGNSVNFNRVRDPYLPAVRLKDAASLYTFMTPYNDPGVSPIFADLTGLPPILIHVSDSEILLSDAVDFYNEGLKQGIDVKLKVFEGCCHVWQFFGGIFNVPEAMESIKESVEFTLEHFE